MKAITIKQIYELSDDMETILIGAPAIKHNYVEIYPRKTVVNGIEEEAFTIRAKTFYHITLSHIPLRYRNDCFVINTDLSLCGIVYNFDPNTRTLFIFNSSENHIFIKKDAVIGEIV